MKFASFITRHVKLVLLIALALTVPAAIGFIATRVNYDILTYLPSDLNSMQGEVLLDKEFKDATISILIVEHMPTKDIEALERRIAKVPGVTAVLGAADILSPSVPVDFLPSAIREKLFVNDSTLLIVKYDGSAMSEETQGAIAAIREECGRQCFVSGASVVLKDTKDLVDRETPIYVLLAVALSVIVLSLTMESFLIPFVFLVEIGLAILYNFGTNFVFGQISYITKALAAVLQLGGDDGLLHLPPQPLRRGEVEETRPSRRDGPRHQEHLPHHFRRGAHGGRGLPRPLRHVADPRRRYRHGDGQGRPLRPRRHRYYPARHDPRPRRPHPPLQAQAPPADLRQELLLRGEALQAPGHPLPRPPRAGLLRADPRQAVLQHHRVPAEGSALHRGEREAQERVQDDLLALHPDILEPASPREGAPRRRDREGRRRQ